MAYRVSERESWKRLKQDCPAHREQEETNAYSCLIARPASTQNRRPDGDDQPEDCQSASILPLQIEWLIAQRRPDQEQQHIQAILEHSLRADPSRSARLAC